MHTTGGTSPRGRARLGAVTVAMLGACVSSTGAPVGPQGGVISSADGRATVSIPPGALGADVDISIRPATSAPPGALAAYEFGPGGTTFSVPVQISLRFDPASLATTGAVVIASADGGAWVPLPAVLVDLDSRSVGGFAAHFSVYGVVPRDPTSPDVSECYCAPGSCTDVACKAARGTELACTPTSAVCTSIGDAAFAYKFLDVLEGCSGRQFNPCTPCIRACLGPPILFDNPGHSTCRAILLDGIDPTPVAECWGACIDRGLAAPPDPPCAPFFDLSGVWSGHFTGTGTLNGVGVTPIGDVTVDVVDVATTVTGSFTSAAGLGGTFAAILEPIEPSLTGVAQGSTAGCAWTGPLDAVYFDPGPPALMGIEVWMNFLPPCTGSQDIVVDLQRP